MVIPNEDETDIVKDTKHPKLTRRTPNE
jgi:hypothetical protein